MKRLATIAVSSVLALVATAAMSQPALAAPAKAVVKGHVRSASGAAIPGVVFKVVQRVPGRKFVSATGRTSRTGRYEVHLPRGESYQLVVLDKGDRDHDDGDGRWAPFSRTVHTGATTVRVDAALQPGAGLSGHVYGTSGKPVRAGLLVRAYSLDGGVPPGHAPTTTLTRAKGVYRFSDLPAGRTLLEFESGEAKTESRYYTGEPGGAQLPADAARIPVRAGKALQRTSFHFVPQRDPDQDLRSYGAVDPVGDAPDFLDVTDLRVQNGASDLVVTTTVPKFDPAALDEPTTGSGTAFTGLTLSLNVTGAGPKSPGNPRPDEFFVDVGPGVTSSPIDSVHFSQFTEDELSEYPCPGLDADVHAGGVVVTVPQSCFGQVTGADAGAVRVSASMQGNVGPQSRSDETARTRAIARS